MYKITVSLANIIISASASVLMWNMMFFTWPCHSASPAQNWRPTSNPAIPWKWRPLVSVWARSRWLKKFKEKIEIKSIINLAQKVNIPYLDMFFLYSVFIAINKFNITSNLINKGVWNVICILIFELIQI